MKFFKKAKLHENTAERDAQMKEIVKQMEEKVAACLGKLARSESTRIASGTKYWRDLGALSETLTRLANKDLSKDGGEAAFVLAWAKFADLMRDIGNNENALWATECNEKLIVPVSTFQKNEAIDLTRVLKKSYDKATDEYSAALAKLDSTHKDPRRASDIMKVYALEKERVRTKKTYDSTILDLTTHCEDVNERLNFEFLEMLIADMNAERLAYQAMSGLFGEVSSYLDDLNGWCEEEKTLFSQHSQERASQRNTIHEQSKTDETRAFLMQFDKLLVDIVRPIARTGESAIDILPPLLGLLSHYKMPVPEGVDTSTPPAPYDNALEPIRLSIKNNFDAIGLALGSAGQLDRIISLSESLAGIEPFQLTPTPTTHQTSSNSNHAPAASPSSP
jgi:hypothetical protein